ncbi:MULTISPECIES: trimeric intracellular cation channel family protein [Halomonas]|uniref:Membrane protein n=1 Tax=Halomonas halophila TaxID=29573 RepID=A0ABQ0U0I3_9GAMM|nr:MULTISPECIES: trimeric intracellular cation channel family protein [Halomonas]MDR5888586.1 trimeric intracellular cation channel family protein [Halomonas salina]RAH37759.1 trimeric intracellular cation channel family protein [Halomonas sp. SL1]WJY07768.1 trimeric intracellular cation channel family protein [Halomonas halophila]GEK72052.1 membrane protein [Halomonas halophila]
MTGWVYWLDMAGVIVFALSGVILACRSRMDPFGMLVLAAMTGIGGGTLRDLVLGVRPVFWVGDPAYLWVILATVGLSILGFHYIHRLSRVFLPVADAFGLALFTVIGTHKALTLDAPGVVAVLMGLLTGVAGGMMRDVLARRVPMVLRQEIYATAAIAGGVVLVGLDALGTPFVFNVAASLATTLGLRLSAIHWRLALPVFAWVTVAPPPAPSEADGETSPPAPPRRPKARVKLIPPKRSRRRRRSS